MFDPPIFHKFITENIARDHCDVIHSFKSMIICLHISTQYEVMQACKISGLTEAVLVLKRAFKPQGTLNYELKVSHF